MEYKTDKRTKNLTLRDIHVGDWVQVWSELTERYSPPLKIIQICDDGTIYLVTDDEERCTPWEENIKDIDALPIDADLLRGFGFDIAVDNVNKDYSYLIVRYNGKDFGLLFHLEGCLTYYYGTFFCSYMHDLIDFWHRNNINIKLEWKGIERGHSTCISWYRKLWAIIRGL